MKTIQTKPDCTLGFVKCPDGYTNMSWIVPNGSKSTSKEIGKLSEITEDQAKELVDLIKCKVTPMYGDEIEVWFGNDYLNKGMTTQDFRHSLQSAALSVGIEEKNFDKYLVVKL